jgi:hypothetical protein
MEIPDDWISWGWLKILGALEDGDGSNESNVQPELRSKSPRKGSFDQEKPERILATF